MSRSVWATTCRTVLPLVLFASACGGGSSSGSTGAGATTAVATAPASIADPPPTTAPSASTGSGTSPNTVDPTGASTTAPTAETADTADTASAPAAATAITADTAIRSGESAPAVPVPRGTAEAPFGPLPESEDPAALVTTSGVIVPVEETWDEGWLVRTPCRTVRLLTEGTPIGRAHVVLDAGHGGREVGAVGAELAEKDLNLAVTERTAEILEALGATVVQTRDFDYSLTTATRGQIAEQVAPALFVSVHHNGGASGSGNKPGTIVFTKAGNDDARRFGGLFYQTLVGRLTELGATKIELRRLYTEALDAHEAAVSAYDESIAARDAALVTNGQIPPTATTAVPAAAPPASGTDRVPSEREAITTTTAAGSPTVAVPDTVPVPPPFELEPVLPFNWAGGGNAGVRSWIRDDGADYLSVLRSSGDVPAVLAEFLYVTNPAEERLLADPAFIDSEAQALADSIVAFISSDAEGNGFIRDQFGDQNIGGGGRIGDCVEPAL